MIKSFVKNEIADVKYQKIMKLQKLEGDDQLEFQDQKEVQDKEDPFDDIGHKIVPPRHVEVEPSCNICLQPFEDGEPLKDLKCAVGGEAEVH